MATTPIVWRAQTTVSDGVPPAGSGLAPNLFFEQPKAFVPLMGGGFIVVWQDGRSFQAQVHDVLGNVQIAAFDLVPFWPTTFVKPFDSSDIGVTTLNDGRVIIGVPGRSLLSTSGESYDFFVFNPDGTRVDFDPGPGEDFAMLMPTTSDADRSGLVLSALDDGGFIAGYSAPDDPDIVASNFLQARLGLKRFDADLNVETITAPDMENMSLADETSTDDRRAQAATFLRGEEGTVVGLANGGFASAWRLGNQTESGGGPFDILVRVFDEDGVPREVTQQTFGGAANDEFLASTASFAGGSPTDPELTALTGGNFVVSWFHFGDNFFQADIKIAVYDGMGEVVRAETDLIEPSNEDPAKQAAKQDFSIVALSDGRFIMGWREFRFTEPATIDEYVVYQVFDETGAALTGQVELASQLDGANGINGNESVFNFSGPTFLELQDGDILAAWGDARVDGFHEAARISADGSQVGATFSPFDTTQVPISNVLRTPFLELLADGRVLASGDDFTGTTFFTILDPRGPVIDGTSEADVLTSRPNGATVNGFGAGDTLIGRDGADTLNGGSGRDDLRGGDGKDTLRGDDGSDDLRGGNGGDTLRGGDSGDDLRGGDGGDTLQGDKGSDNLRGNNGKDTLLGGDGGDTLIGGSGNDELIGQKGKDSLTGGSGQDDFIFNGQAHSGTTGSRRDDIMDFDRGENDTIDLSDLVSGRLDFLGTRGFQESNTNQLRIADQGDDVRVRIDFDGDRQSDFDIDVLGINTLRESDFLL